MKNNTDYASMTVDELNAFLEKEEPIADQKASEAYAAPTVQEFEVQHRLAYQEHNKASKYLRLKTTDLNMEPHDDIGDLFDIESFKANVESGGFINYDGFGYYANETEQSNIEVYPSDVKSGIYRKDFSHVKWYNR